MSENGETVWNSTVDPQGSRVFSVRERLVDPRLVIDGRAAKLSPGMAVQAYVVTGRRLIDYLLLLVTRAMDEAGRERWG